MRLVLKVALATLAVAVIAAASTLLAGSIAWNRTTSGEARLLHLDPGLDTAAGRASDFAPGHAAIPDADAALPAPVARYLARSAPDAGRVIRSARLEQEGRFLLRPPDGWAPFTATQHFRAEPPAFVWDARIRMAPLVTVRVRDAYRDGAGSIHGAIGGLVTVVHEAGTPEMAEASLYRYLAESAWLPTRLRPSPSLRWDPLDRRTALATLRDGPTEVTVRFHFDENADIVGIHVPARDRQVDGGYEPTPWTGRFWGHRVIDGLRVPTAGEVAWVVDGEVRPYWRGRIVAADYRFR